MNNFVMLSILTLVVGAVWISLLRIAPSHYALAIGGAGVIGFLLTQLTALVFGMLFFLTVLVSIRVHAVLEQRIRLAKAFEILAQKEW